MSDMIRKSIGYLMCMIIMSCCGCNTLSGNIDENNQVLDESHNIRSEQPGSR